MKPAEIPLDRRPRVIVLAFSDRPEVVRERTRLQPLIAQHADIVPFDTDSSSDWSAVEADLAIVLGGDGSILRAARLMGTHQIPVIGVNMGKLGFLADLLPGQLVNLLPDIFAGRCRIVQHLMFDCHLVSNGQSKLHVVGLNEVAIMAGPPFAILDVQLYVDAELATTYSCDGLIVSTPVGSTAHGLSAGGPIVRKDVDGFVISPISPHTLTNRPIVDSADRVYELVVPRPHEGTSLVVDGQMLAQLTARDRVRVQRSEARFKLVEVRGHGYYRTLREKLGWGGRVSDAK